jgi:hypothetical protein
MSETTVSVPLPNGQPDRDPVYDDGPGLVPAAKASPLLSLRERRDEITKNLHLDVRVPRWGDVDDGPQIWIRFEPANPSEFSDRIEKAQKNTNKPKDWMIRENANVLVKACVGVFALQGEEPADDEVDARERLSLREGDPYGDWTKFDPDLAESLGLAPNCGAIAVCRALFLTEADLTGAANKLLRWSGMSLGRTDEDFTAG